MQFGFFFLYLQSLLLLMTNFYGKKENPIQSRLQRHVAEFRQVSAS